MINIRKGKTVHLTVSVLTDGKSIPLEGRDISIELKDPLGDIINLQPNISGAVISAFFYPSEQRLLGQYVLTIWENKGERNQIPVDIVPAFQLVRYTTDEGGESCADLDIQTVDLGVADIGTAELADALFAVEETKKLSDNDLLIIKTHDGFKRITASSLRDYCNQGLTVKIKEI